MTPGFTTLPLQALKAAEPVAHDQMVSVRLETDISDELLDECERLLALHPRAGNVFAHRAMAKAAMHPANAGDSRIVFAVVQRGHQVASIWPLKLARHFGVMVASDLISPVSQYNDIIGDTLEADELKRLVACLRSEFGADALLVRRARTDSGLANAFIAHAPQSETAASTAPFVDLAVYGSFANYAARFGKQTVRTRRQRRQKLEKQNGPLTFSVLSGSQARDKIATALQWKRKWLSERGLTSSVFDGGKYEAMLRRIAENDNARVSVLSAGHHPVAIEIGLIHGEHYAAYLGAFDPVLTRFSLGQEQMLRTLEWCFAQNFSSYDMLPPDDDYKLSWTDAQEPVRDYCIGMSPLGAGYVLLRRLGHSRVQSTLRALPGKARRYGPVAIGVGATAAAIGILAD